MCEIPINDRIFMAYHLMWETVHMYREVHERASITHHLHTLSRRSSKGTVNIAAANHRPINLMTPGIDLSPPSEIRRLWSTYPLHLHALGWLGQTNRNGELHFTIFLFVRKFWITWVIIRFLLALWTMHIVVVRYCKLTQEVRWTEELS